MPRLRIAIADANRETLDSLREMLMEYGHEVVTASTSCHDLIAACKAHRPNLIITDGEVDCKSATLIAAVKEICENEPTPVIVLSSGIEGTEIKDVRGSDTVTAHLIRPVSDNNLIASISLSMSRFSLYVSICKEVVELKKSMQDRKLVERAKGILMSRANLTESQAHSRLQELASARNLKVVQIADIIVEAECQFSSAIDRA